MDAWRRSEQCRAIGAGGEAHDFEGLAEGADDEDFLPLGFNMGTIAIL